VVLTPGQQQALQVMMQMHFSRFQALQALTHCDWVVERAMFVAMAEVEQLSQSREEDRARAASLELMEKEQENKRSWERKQMEEGCCEILSSSMLDSTSSALLHFETGSKLLRRASCDLDRGLMQSSTLLTTLDPDSLRLRRNIMRLLMLEKKSVQWYNDAAAGFFSDLARRCDDKLTSVAWLQEASAEIMVVEQLQPSHAAAGAAALAKDTAEGESTPSPFGTDPHAADMRSVADFLEVECQALEESLFAFPEDGTGLPPLFRPYAAVAVQAACGDEVQVLDGLFPKDCESGEEIASGTAGVVVEQVPGAKQPSTVDDGPSVEAAAAAPPLCQGQEDLQDLHRRNKKKKKKKKHSKALQGAAAGGGRGGGGSSPCPVVVVVP